MLKATIKCSCGCKYELLSTSTHEAVICPNCSEPFIESEKLISILEIFASMDLDSHDDLDYLTAVDKIFNGHKLQLQTISEFDILSNGQQIPDTL